MPYCFPKQIKAHTTVKWNQWLTFPLELSWLQNHRSPVVSVSWMEKWKGVRECKIGSSIYFNFFFLPFFRLLTPCSCRGSQGFVHRGCLECWLSQSGLSHCELCRFQFPTANHLRWVFFSPIFLHTRRSVGKDEKCVIFDSNGEKLKIVAILWQSSRSSP